MDVTSHANGLGPAQPAAGAFDYIPNELIHKILQHVSPEDCFQRIPLLSRRFNELSHDSRLWRDYCVQSFRHWNREYCIQVHLARNTPNTQWRKLWKLRKLINARIAILFNQVLASKVNRFEKIGQICQYARDAKDFLLEQYHAPESAEDHLARRYYANLCLASIHRGFALEAWMPYQRGQVSFNGVDRALGAFDMFFVRGDEWDIDDTGALLDKLAQEFLQSHEGFEGLCTRDKALALLQWVRKRNLTGMDNATQNYRHLRNCLIGFALRDEKHPSLPLISSAIYVSLAERVGLAAACCAFPAHVHVIVFAPTGQDLEGNDFPSDHVPSSSSPPDRMLLDPFRSGEEMHADDLRRHLQSLNWVGSVEQDDLLLPGPVTVLVIRIAHNMRKSIEDMLGRAAPASESVLTLRDNTPPSRHTLETVSYAASLASLVVASATHRDWDSVLDRFLHYLTRYFPEDAHLVEKYIVPLYNAHIELVPPRRRLTQENVPEILHLLRNSDARQPTTSRRYTQEIHQNVWYTVGQVFRHKRYGYVGIINGWGEKGTASLPATPNMSMDELMDEMSDSGTDSDTIMARLRKKVFYTCLTPRHDRAVVSQDAIEIIRDPSSIPAPLMDVAGKFFKRFDSATCTFVSNIKEYFPDD